MTGRCHCSLVSLFCMQCGRQQIIQQIIQMGQERDEFMRAYDRYKILGRKSVLGKLMILIILCSLMTAVLLPEGTVYAQWMEGVTNPKDIVIASPADNYTTTSSKVSILGACDYDYPLYMNNKQIETTALGFFTQYVTLSIGKNVFTFTNNKKTKTLTIIRKAVSDSGSIAQEPDYIAYTTDKYGVLDNEYTMPRSSIDSTDVDCMPLTDKTAFKILGEQGSYYKIYDGTFIHKSYVDVYSGALPANKVSAVTVTDDVENNLIVAKLKMKVNSLYKVELADSKVILTLYETISSPKAALSQNDTVKRVVTNIYKSTTRTVVYTFRLYEDAMVCGYDVEFKDGIMIFTLKKAPHLTEEGSLAGATVLLDAGHGGEATGAVGPLGLLGPVEKDINLAITLYTKEYLEQMGATVVLTRSDDTDLSLHERVAVIREQKPDVSMSIHANAMPQAANFNLSYGFLSYYSYNETTNAHTLINDSMISLLGYQARAPRKQSLSLTRITTCAALLIETAFLSYPSDYEYLIQVENQKAIAEGAAAAIQEYLEGVAVYGAKMSADTAAAEREQITYVVVWGDTLSSIAGKFGVSLDSLAAANNITNINYIYGGQVLVIPQ